MSSLYKPQISEEFNNTNKEKLVWDKDKEQQFPDVLQGENSRKQMDSATHELESDVNGALSIFVDCLISASQCMFVKRSPSRKFRDAAWFESECREAKTESRNKLRIFRRTHGADDRKDYVQASRQYRRMIRGKKSSLEELKLICLHPI